MKITGYKMQHALRELGHQRDIAASQFSDGLMAFPDETKPSAVAAMATFQKTEQDIALLQTAQAEYNLRVPVKVLDQAMPLAQAIKLVGGAGRAEKMWRSAASGEKKDRYAYRENVRSTNEITAKRTVSVDEAVKRAKEAARWASALREAIQVGNATEIEIERLDPALFTE